jgi:hypothetical protein
MNMQRFIVLLLTLCLLLVFALGWYLRRRPAPPPTANEVSPTATAAPTWTPQPEAKKKIQHRLAGTVVGDEQYVVVELPDGRNELYTPGQSVPGLGRVVSIGPDQATFDGDAGRVTLRLLPAPTPTATPTGSAAEEAETTTDSTPKARPPRGRSGP